MIKPKISLKHPSYDDYASLYEKRFLPEVVYWADDCAREMTLKSYANDRIMAQDAAVMIERVILLGDRPIGTVTARDLNRQRQSCTLSIVIADPEYWGHGYGSIALGHFLTLLGIDGFKRVYLDTFSNNKRAQGCFYKHGFTKRRAYFSPPAGRYIVQMVKRLDEPQSISDLIKPGDPRWKDITKP